MLRSVPPVFDGSERDAGGAMGRLDGKVALITGGASGMGMVASRLFASEGARVLLTDVADEAGETVAKEIEGVGGAAAYVHADVSNEADAKDMVAAAVERFGGLDVLYNNAGVMLPEDGSVHSTDASIWDTTLAINVKGVAFGCKYGVPAMIESGGGSIINVASFVAWLGAATSQTAYTASKGAVLAMTREIAVEYARKGIRCNALCPGPIETPLLMELLSDEARRRRRLVHIPMGRLGRAEELAKAALFLASDDSSYMTGASLIVDGGITAAYVTPED
jgi:NAD(P)-dependent dehydrogenase (short-subunit alcohol dehydrogenase family)